MRLVIVLLFITSLSSCANHKHSYAEQLVIVIPEDGCTQERGCTCGHCPPYGVDKSDSWWHRLWARR